jgi:DNA-binding CsgD family transcriptional regulator
LSDTSHGEPRYPGGAGTSKPEAYGRLISAVENRSFTDDRTFSEVKRLSTAGLEGPELLRRVAGRLRRSVPFEAFCASTVDPATNLMTHGIAEGMGEDSGDEANIFLDQIYFEEDLPQFTKMAREGRQVALLSESTGGELDRSLRYRHLLRPFGFGYELGSVFVDGSAWGGMDLIRTQDDPDLDAREVRLVRKAVPHITAGLRSAALRRAATVEPTAEDAPGVLNLDRRGHVISHTPSAERLLAELQDLDPRWRKGVLPMSVRSVANAVRRALAPGTDRDENLVPRVRVRARSGRWLTLHASLTEPGGTAGGASETVVVVEPARPLEVAWLNAAAHGLTPREEEVVRLVLRGSTTREISRALFISEYTVQRHLQNVFEKMGVKSRTELLKRLFFEDLLPSTFGG